MSVLPVALVGWGEVCSDPGVPTTIGKEWGHFGGLILLVVSCELGQRKSPGPIVLSVIDVAPEILFHYRIEPLCLAIGPWVVWRRELDCDSESFAQ